jgi:hypothetical protein
MSANTPQPRPIAYRANALHQIAPWSRSSTYKFIRQGRLPVKRVGGITLVMADDLDRFLAQLSEVDTKLTELLNDLGETEVDGDPAERSWDG